MRLRRTHSLPRRGAWGLLALAGLACSDATEPVSTPPLLTAVAVGADSGSIFRTLHVTLAQPTGVQVDYWTAASPKLRVTDSARATEHVVFLPELRERQTYDYEIRMTGEGLARPPVSTGRFTTDSLPGDLGQLAFTSLGTPTRRLTMLELRGTPFAGYVIVDQDGAVVWFRRGVAEAFARRANGDLVLLDRNPGLTEVRPDLRVVAQLPQNSSMLMHHDVIATPDNTLLFLAQDVFSFEGEQWVGDAIWEWDPDAGTLERRWTARDFLSPASDLGPKSVPSDWLHANSLDLGPRGNVLISLPALNQIVSIAPGFASLEWRLGGPNATIVPDAAAEFWFEHTAQEIAPNRVLMFDNGRDRPAGLFSRALELRLEPAHGTATRVWEFRPSPDIYAPIIGSARRLPNGHTLVNFGTRAGVLGSSGPIAAYESAPDGRVPWILRVMGGSLLNYRATPIESIAGEVVVGAAR